MLAWIVLMITGKPLADMPDIQLPSEFRMTWGGVCSIWVIGRTAEKRGTTGKLVSLVIGSK